MITLLLPITGFSQTKFGLVDGLSQGKTYGSYCGIVGQHPPSRIQLEKMLKEENIEQLTSWLESPNTVLQTYAAEGFMRLVQTKKHQPSAEIISKIDKMRSSQTEIPSCTGCVYSRITMEKALEDFEWNPAP